MKFDDIVNRLSQKVEEVISNDFLKFWPTDLLFKFEDIVIDLAKKVVEVSPNISNDFFPIDLLTYFLNFQ